MLEQLQDIEHKYQALQARLSAPETYDDPALVARLNREARELAPLVQTYQALQGQKERLAQAEELLGDAELGEIAKEEAALARKELENLEQRLKLLLLPSDPNDSKNVILEIRAGVGGEESALFAHSLYRMYA
ncbi:MAG: PCRF domain-containing protein, partial [Oscillospiraceae bacterium]|nr:PCRF domain-containing protein [Oscillospiraceae bacterium]